MSEVMMRIEGNQDTVHHLVSAKTDLASIILSEINTKLLDDIQVRELLNVTDEEYLDLRCGDLESFELWDLFEFAKLLGLDVYISIYKSNIFKAGRIFVRDERSGEEFASDREDGDELL